MRTFWAKTTPDRLPGVEVLQHMLVAGHVACQLATRFQQVCEPLGIGSDMAGFLAATHDCGKISRYFQSKCPAWLQRMGWEHLAKQQRWTDGQFLHGTATQNSLALFLQKRALCDSDSATYWAAIAGAHHGSVLRQPCNPIPEAPDPKTLDWEAERQTVLETAWTHFHSPRLPDVDPHTPSLWFMAGLISISDWIGSDERFFPAHEKLHIDAIPERVTTVLNAFDLHPVRPRRHLSFQDMFGEDKCPHAIQTSAFAHITRPGTYVLEAPMGMGKTEAALFAAYGLMERGLATGIYFALPTQATSNRIHLRLAEFVQRICPESFPARLIHANAWLLEQTVHPQGGGEEQEANLRWFASAKRALLAPFGVGTVDQALLTVLAARHFFVRRFALAGKVVILDEVHSYDMYTGTLIVALCRELEKLGCTVIILSATLTPILRASLLGEQRRTIPAAPDPYPLLTGKPMEVDTARPCSFAVAPQEQGTVPPKDVEIRFAPRETLLEDCVCAAQQGARVLWICNTVESAQTTFTALSQKNSNALFDSGLLHSRFPQYRREELESFWLERFGKHAVSERGAVLVSTQIVEQSVDIDADMLITELAPTDLLLQRMGRLHRHQRGVRLVSPCCHIVAEQASLDALRDMDRQGIADVLGAKAYVYAPYTLLRALEVWSARQQVRLPDDIRMLLDETYAEPATPLPAAWEALRQENTGKEMAQKLLGQFRSNVWTLPLPDREGVQTRLVEQEQRVIALGVSMDDDTCRMLNGDEIRLREPLFHLPTAKALHRNAVRLPAWLVKECTTDKKWQRYGLDGIAIQQDNLLWINGQQIQRMEWSTTLGVRILNKKEVSD